MDKHWSFGKGVALSVLLCFLWGGSRAAIAQSGWIHTYEAHLEETRNAQPHWSAPLVTTSPLLEDGFRTDFVRQSLAGGQQSWDYGSTKGVQVVPFRRLEFRFSPPPFLTHTDSQVEDGFGDVAFRLKYRVYSSNERHRNAAMAALLGASLPTGKNGNGTCCAVLSPAVSFGKGFGRFALTSSLSGSLPVSNAGKLGRQIGWNNAAQFRLTEFLWTQTEFDSTRYFEGRYDGRWQSFVTPGLTMSRIPLVQRNAVLPLALTLGLGEQIALTHFNTYNHSPIFSARLRF